MCSSRIFVFSVVLISSVTSKPRIACDVDDHRCLTEGADRSFDEFIKGIPGVLPSDPLRLEYLEVDLPTVSYKLIGASLSGMSDCKVDFVKIYRKEKKYHYHISCPHLTFQSKCDLKGYIGPQYIEGKGATCKVDHYDYNFLFNGDFYRKVRNDNKVYFELLTSNLEIETKGKVVYQVKDLFNGNKEKTAAVQDFLNEHWQFVNKLLRTPTMGALMKKYIKNINTYLSKVPVDDIFYQD
uniref:SFRICE_005820 n=1 Tax=Spodoptera frugiperda TaxID=7108 RepID=A0A2H1V0R7_SPOFR